MKEKVQRILESIVIVMLVFQLAGCGTLLYPERRGQIAGRLDAGVVILDAIGLLFFIIPGVIAFAVDFSNGCIYLPAHPPVIVHTMADLKVIKFDPKHTTLAQVEKIIRDETGYNVKLTQNDVRVTRLASLGDMVGSFAAAVPSRRDERLALDF